MSREYPRCYYSMAGTPCTTHSEGLRLLASLITLWVNVCVHAILLIEGDACLALIGIRDNSCVRATAV